MASVEFILPIHAPIELVYRVTQDYAVRYEWDPFPEKIEFLDGATEVALGVKVRVLAKSGMRMDVQFVQVAPPNVAAIVMTRGPALLQRFAGSWSFRSQGEQLTQVKFRYLIKTRLWALPWISEPIAAWYFGRTIKARLAGLKRYCENLAPASINPGQ